MSPMVISAWAGAFVTVAGAVTLIVRFFVKAVKATVSEDLRALREKVDEVHARADSRLETMEKCLSDVRAELRPNGGDSLRDSVDRLERVMVAHLRTHEAA